jgi:protein-S-isoprenylcysteine O-methyltransferase
LTFVRAPCKFAEGDAIMRIAAIVLFGFSVLTFCVMEVWLERRQIPGLDESQDDRSLKRITICRNLSLLVIVLSVIFPLVQIPGDSALRFLVSAALVLTGTAIRFRAITTLGSWFTNAVATQPGQKVIRQGLYKYIRHPAYTGGLVFFLGVGLSTDSVWGLAVIVSLMLYALLSRIKVEEKVMLASFGQEYLDYMKNTKKLVPFIF